MTIPELSTIEVRVLGTLAEKARTVPDSYPLTLNALVSGCNQKTSRDPVMEVSDAQAQQALDSLRSMNLVIESSGGRVPRYSHNFERVLQVPAQSAALLAVLMLRGPQTAGELRINCDRLHKFTDISSVEGFLHELAERPAGALVVELARQPGSREKSSRFPRSARSSSQNRPASSRDLSTVRMPKRFTVAPSFRSAGSTGQVAVRSPILPTSAPLPCGS